MGRFWIEDDFIDKYTKTLSMKAQIVYVCLCRHSNRSGYTSIGKRKIAKLCGINVSTAKLALQELEVSGLCTPYKYGVGGFTARGGRKLHPLVGGITTPKGSKEVYKEGQKNKTTTTSYKERMLNGKKLALAKQYTPNY